MSITLLLEEQASALERDATALRKLGEAADELGEERIRALLAPLLNENGHGNNGHVAEPQRVSEPVATPRSPTLSAAPRLSGRSIGS